ncbi:ABC transporter permease [Streptomyces sp. AV19]|uniref:ABC transporter permease n=1 Tax=Streptomyces sp. AV19 TaxID=2793068 RepID=UPI0018FE2645|nr:ABC transporter permease [Streptomyces sp. AV19]MBH1933707.1 ABC transporter permease [Streptomyces sp. AV19]MDG4535787.1 ABC transporter permease subunit [Streptomyces sp. AV19]
MTAPMTPPPAAPAPQGQAPAQQFWPGQAPAGGYVSPIPVRQATLGDAIAAEWTKIRSLRSTMWTLGTMLVIVMGIGALIALVTYNVADEGDIQGDVLGMGFVGVLLGMIPLLTLGVLTISSEYGTGLIRTTLTACPSRGRVLGAKAIVFFALTFVLTLVATTLVALLDAGLMSDLTTEGISGSEWLKATLGVSLYVALLGLLSLAVGALLRHSAGAITSMLGLVLLPPLLALFMMSDAVRPVGKALATWSIPSQLATFYGAELGDGGPSGWTPLWVVLGVTAIALGGAYTSMTRRDA